LIPGAAAIGDAVAVEDDGAGKGRSGGHATREDG
jgi:hypothetical protein